MLGDAQAVGKSARARFEQRDGTRDGFAILEGERGLIQQAAHRDQLGVLVLVKGRLQSPHRFRQHDICHEQ